MARLDWYSQGKESKTHSVAIMFFGEQHATEFTKVLSQSSIESEKHWSLPPIQTILHGFVIIVVASFFSKIPSLFPHCHVVVAILVTSSFHCT